MKEMRYIPWDCVKRDGKIVKVTSVAPGLGKDNIKIGFSDGWQWTAHYKDFSDDVFGIPLTSETLEKNGWIKFSENEDLILYKHPTSRCISVEIPKQRRAKVAYIYDECLIVFHYVHQLQHLLFGLGLDSSLKV